MNSILIFILKVMICSGIFTGYYWLALRNRKFHQYNRFYLLVSVVLPFIIPFVRISFHHNDTALTPDTVKLLQVIGSGNELLNEIIIHPNNSRDILLYSIYIIYAAVTTGLLIRMLIGLWRIRKIYSSGTHTIINKIHIINSTAPETPFSFLHYIFWNMHIDLNSTAGKKIMLHELAHVQQKHSIDKLFVNTLCSIAWFNPFFWLIKHELNLIHEFIADKAAVEEGNSSDFAAMILQAAYPKRSFGISNPFFYSPIKRRLNMINKVAYSKAGYAGRIIILPLLLLIISAFGLKAINDPLSATTSSVKNPITVVVDAGHGGNDMGAKNDNGITEKEITLAIVNKIKALNNNDNIHIVLTRSNDDNLPPGGRLAIAQQQKADLFISIHISATADKSSTESGLQIYMPSATSPWFEKSRLLASAIIGECSNHYELPVSANPKELGKQALILKENICPAVIIEAGYINNEKDMLYLQSEAGQSAIAANILRAIEKYAANQEKLTAGNSPSTPDKKSLQNRLIIVDQQEITEAALKQMPTDNLASMNVLDEEAGEAKYGAKGKNGVIEIVTKKDQPSPTGNADAANNSSSEDAPVFTKVEQEAQFVGGISAWRQYLQKNLEAQVAVKEGWKPGTYTINIQFIVDKEGNVSNVKALNYAGTKTAAHCIKIIENGPKWQPAKQNNRAVNAIRKQPITFIIN